LGRILSSRGSSLRKTSSSAVIKSVMTQHLPHCMSHCGIHFEMRGARLLRTFSQSTIAFLRQLKQCPSNLYQPPLSTLRLRSKPPQRINADLESYKIKSNDDEIIIERHLRKLVVLRISLWQTGQERIPKIDQVDNK
jgi:hypothetical protein